MFSCRSLQSPHACCRSAESAGCCSVTCRVCRTQKAAQLELENCKGLDPEESGKDACLRSEALACAPVAMLDAEGRSDMTNVLQHCHGGKGIFSNILLT